MENNTIRHSHESVLESALKYSNLKDWRTNNVGMYKYAKKHKILKECIAHMKNIYVRHTFESCMKSALKYSNLKDWKNADIKSYSYAVKEHILNQCTAHMEIKTLKYHSFESCMESASKYSTKSDWSMSKEDGKLYRFALKEGWLKECTAHMIKLNGISRTKEECIADAKKYNSQKEWRENSPTIYGYANSKKWLIECSANLIILKKTKTKEECIADAKKYTTREDWRKNSSTFFFYVKKKKWMNEIKSTLKCEKCGENHIATLDFHHINPNEKEFQIAQSYFSKEKILEEMKKCIVLCSNCHRKLHWEEKQTNKAG
jgi:hypothetical protein